MSRTKHTRPPQLIAADRVRDPREPRAFGDPSREHRIRQVLKELGISEADAVESGCAVAHNYSKFSPGNETSNTPKITVKRPRKGFFHPATKSQINELLMHFGELSWYGVQEIVLLQSPKHDVNKLNFGSLSIPGKIQLYEQPEAPWFLSGSLRSEERLLLESAGALIELSSDGMRCNVEWPLDTLTNFMLFEVLMHEVGHHIIQQFKGKRTAKVLRTKEHEILAMAFARRCRHSYFDSKSL